MKQLVVKATYNVIKRATIGELLAKKAWFKNCYFVVDETDDPIHIRDSLDWLQTRSKNKKVWILKFATEAGKFETITDE